jgi:thymidylate synthase
MKIMGVTVDTRNGKARRILGPVATAYQHPTERMLRDVRRDANPFFHIFESVWMLAGRNDVEWISQFNSNIGQYSDNGETFHGAYGHRWRNHFGHDQLMWAIEHLKAEPNSRRTVVQMFDPDVDQAYDGGKDIPCNTAIYFEIVEGKLNMTVTNRSNDIVWGCYGANAVHMSILQEFVANALGATVGQYLQISNNFHIYEGHFPFMDAVADPHGYSQEMASSHVPITTPATWRKDLSEFEDWIVHPRYPHNNKFITNVLNPMVHSWEFYKLKNRDNAFLYASTITDLEVKIACEEWLQRRNWEKT